VKLAVSPDDRLNSLLIFTNPFSHVQFHLHSTGQRPNIHILNKKKITKKCISIGLIGSEEEAKYDHGSGFAIQYWP